MANNNHPRPTLRDEPLMVEALVRHLAAREIWFQRSLIKSYSSIQHRNSQAVLNAAQCAHASYELFEGDSTLWSGVVRACLAASRFPF